jgi:uncharacterized protein (DUF1015 family)
MPEIQAFRALRYNLGHVGSLSDVVAPPYDVIGPDLQEELYQKHPCNVVRLILNRQEPGDDEVNNKYSRAKRFLKNWQSEGVLFTEADPAIYVYYQEFSTLGRTYTRRGFMARMRLSRFGEGNVFPHEETMSGPKVDRLMLTVMCKANLSQIFGLYPDPQEKVGALLDRAVDGVTPLESTDHLGVIHRLWPVSNVGVIAELASLMGKKPIFIADGHHRYETACNYRDQLHDSGLLRADHPAQYVLTHFVAMEDPGLLVLPTHRLFRGLPPLNAESLRQQLGDYFTTRPAGEGPQQAHAVWEDVETAGDQGTIGLYTAADRRWTIASITAAGRARVAELAAEHSAEWQGLGVAILHQLVVKLLYRDTPVPKPEYLHLVDEVVEGLESGQFPVGALVMPATVEQVREISMHGERMPAKSTYFYPKLLSGLVINPLE